MPPKKKEKGKKDTGYVIDGVSTTEMTREQLELFAYRLREEMEREREERNYFQLERDKLRTFWEITRQQLEENRADLRNKDRQIEEGDENHEVEVKEYKQKVKHLLYEHQSNLAELKAEAMVSLKMAQDDYTAQEMELLKDKKDLKAHIREQELTHQEEMRTVKLQHSSEISKIRSTFESEAREIEAKYERRISTQRSEFNLKHSMELTEVEERKNKQVDDLVKSHEVAFADMKNYYNDITLNNLALISSLKEQMEEMKQNNDRMEKNLHEVQAENKRLVEPLEQARAQVADLSRRMLNYEKDKISMNNTKLRLTASQKELDDLKWETQVLEIRFDKLQKERDELHSRFLTAILELQQKTGLRNVLLEKKLTSMTDQLEQKEAQISEVLHAANLEPSAMTAVNVKLEELLGRKNTTIQDLQYELARVCKAHDDLLQTYEGKLAQYGVPREELGFVPLRVGDTGPKVGRGPAGLVTANR